MTDNLTTEERSRVMAAVKGKNTKPELRVRRALHGLGYRFRLQRKDLPGKPDIVLPRYKLCVFVHGCFWHQHPGCKRATIPDANREFWLEKFAKNRRRDEIVRRELEALGWRVRVIWECATKAPEKLDAVIKSCFG